jgi:hypothetical protein
MDRALLAAVGVVIVAAIYVRWRLYASRPHKAVPLLFISFGLAVAAAVMVPDAYFGLAFGIAVVLGALTAVGIFARPN